MRVGEMRERTENDERQMNRRITTRNGKIEQNEKDEIRCEEWNGGSTDRHD